MAVKSFVKVFMSTNGCLFNCWEVEIVVYCKINNN